jgi:hypothetical protein
VAAFIGFAWSLRRMRQESAEQLERVTDELRRVRAESHVLSERVAALATLVAAIPARVEQRPVEAPRAPRRDASPSAVTKPRAPGALRRHRAEIVATCGVPDSEARLLQRLHGGESQREDVAVKRKSRAVKRISSTARHAGRNSQSCKTSGDQELPNIEQSAHGACRGRYAVDGRVVLGASCTIHEARQLREQLLAQAQLPGPYEIDGSAVQQVDTAGVQLVVAFALDCLERGITMPGGTLAGARRSDPRAGCRRAAREPGLTAMTLDLAQFHDTFFAESSEALDSMEDALLKLSAGDADLELINTIFPRGAFHQGWRATFGFTEVTAFTHTLETLLDQLRSGKRASTPRWWTRCCSPAT